MNKIIKIFLVIVSISVILFGIFNFYLYQKNKQGGFNKNNNYYSKEINSKNKGLDYTTKYEVLNILRENPEIVINALKNYTNQKQEEDEQALKNLGSAPFNNQYDGRAGNINAPNKILLFFSYGCHHCVEMSETIFNILKERNDVYVTFKDFPLGARAMNLSHASFILNTIAPDKYEVFHKALMRTVESDDTQSVIQNSMLELGLSSDQQSKFKAAISDKNIIKAFENKIKENLILGNKIRLSGTPAMIINNMMIPGVIPPQYLVSLLKVNHKTAAD